jgi:hypothetical protein
MEKHQDKILLVLALLVLGGAVAFTIWQKDHAAGTKGKASASAGTMAYQPVAVNAPEMKPNAATWNAPTPQSKEDTTEVFEVATSPWIYVDKVTGAVTFVAPIAKGIRSVPDFGVEFIGTRDDYFPLQLIGVSGGQAVFMDVITGNTFIAQSGYDGPNTAHVGGDKADNPANLDRHLMIRNVVVKSAPLAGMPDSTGTTITEDAAFAEVFDPATGETFNLNSQTRLLQGKPFAQLRQTVGDQKGSVVALRVGGSLVVRPYKFHDPNPAVLPEDWDTAPATYTVSAINLGPPPTVDVTRQTSDLVRPDVDPNAPDTDEKLLDLVR